MNEIATKPVSSDDMRAALAAELAVGILPLPDILKRFDMTSAELKVLMKDANFKQMVSQFKREWNEASNSKERVRIKAVIMVEENLLELHSIFNDIELNPSARLDAFKQMVSLADVAPKTNAPDSGPKFNLTLNLGSSREPVTIDATTVDSDQNP